MAPPDFSARTKATLAARSAHICNNPQCLSLTVGPDDAQGELALRLGEAAHIRAARVGQARYDTAMTDEHRAAIANGIWLCASCHTMIDKNAGASFSVETLHAWKDGHEQLIQSLVQSHRSIVPLLRPLTPEGRIAQALVDTLAAHGAFFVHVDYEVTNHVIASLERVRKEVLEMMKAVRFDSQLRQVLHEVADECRRYMNETGRFPASMQAGLDRLRDRTGVLLARLERDYGCRIYGEIGSIVQRSPAPQNPPASSATVPSAGRSQPPRTPAAKRPQFTADQKTVELLHDVFTEAKTSVRDNVCRRGFSLTQVRLGSELRGLKVPMVRAQFAEAATELLVNCVKYAHPDLGRFRVEIAARQIERTVEMQIKDWGIGIVAGSDDQLFLKSSVRAKTIATADNTGLGLAFVHEVVIAHGGSIQLSSPRDPTTFTIVLPL